AHRLATEIGEDSGVGAGRSLVARMAGDEFVVLVEGPEAEPLRVAERALDVVRRPVVSGPHRIVVSASIGVVERADSGSGKGELVGAADLMRAADTTLQWAKQDGRNRVAEFDAERHRAAVARFELSARLPEALDAGEFVVEYQPPVRLSDQRPVGAEALARRQPPVGVRIGPVVVMPVDAVNGSDVSPVSA